MAWVDSGGGAPVGCRGAPRHVGVVESAQEQRGYGGGGELQWWLEKREKEGVRLGAL